MGMSVDFIRRTEKGAVKKMVLPVDNSSSENHSSFSGLILHQHLFYDENEKAHLV